MNLQTKRPSYYFDPSIIAYQWLKQSSDTWQNVTWERDCSCGQDDCSHLVEDLLVKPLWMTHEIVDEFPVLIEWCDEARAILDNAHIEKIFLTSQPVDVDDIVEQTIAYLKRWAEDDKNEFLMEGFRGY